MLGALGSSVTEVYYTVLVNAVWQCVRSKCHYQSTVSHRVKCLVEVKCLINLYYDVSNLFIVLKQIYE